MSPRNKTFRAKLKQVLSRPSSYHSPNKESKLYRMVNHVHKAPFHCNTKQDKTAQSHLTKGCIAGGQGRADISSRETTDTQLSQQPAIQNTAPPSAASINAVVMCGKIHMSSHQNCPCKVNVNANSRFI